MTILLNHQKNILLVYSQVSGLRVQKRLICWSTSWRVKTPANHIHRSRISFNELFSEFVAAKKSCSNKKVLVRKGIATREQEATSSSWHYY